LRSSNNILRVDTDGDLWIGHATQGSAPFQVSKAGAVIASDLTITGGSLSVGSSNNILRVDTDGDLWIGHATQGSAPFQVSKAGAVIASDITIVGGGIGVVICG
jgi:phosphohistidine swiveling domain-containing protein